MTFELHATFPGEGMANEAKLKLLALRVDSLSGDESASLSATVGDDVVDRVATVIEQAGGVCEWE